MATTLTYTISAYTPFTKILSASINQDKTDIQSRINWAGGTSATTGLGDDNIQSVAASGGGLTRATKLKLGTASHVVINDGTGAMSSEAQLSTARGGMGIVTTPAVGDSGKVLAVNVAETGYELVQTPVPPALRPVSYNLYS